MRSSSDIGKRRPTAVQRRTFMQRFAALLALSLFLFGTTAVAADTDPPARVGRINLLEGGVAFRNNATGETQPAELNWPITDQAALATGHGSRAEVQIGSSTVRLDADSELEFAVLDDERVHLRLIEGTVAVRVQNRDQLTGFAIETPQGRVTLQDVGRYRVDSGGDTDALAITAHEGAARYEGADGSFIVQP